MIDLHQEFKDVNSKYLDEIIEYASDIIENDEYLTIRNYIQHGNITTFMHSILVTCKCLEIADHIKKPVDRKSLCRAALLHDYCKYDWHVYAKENGLRKLHGYYHPNYAAENATKDFGISKLEDNAIKSHMFPLGFELPHSTEAWILTIADKNCALLETCHKI